MAIKKGKKSEKKKIKKTVSVGIVHINTTFNNTIISFTDKDGNVLCWSSSGCNGFKGSRKSTPFAAQSTAQKAAEKAKEYGMREVEVRVNGPGQGRESAIRAIQTNGIDITVIKDITPLPHNGCRPPKKRRI